MSASDNLGSDDIATLLREAENWPPELKARAVELVRQQTSTVRRVWYCQRGRDCDGQPHEGADYPHARGNQWPPRGNDWLTWFIRSGRGFGKTRSAAEWVRYISNKVGRIAMVGRRGVDVRLTMVEGESGLEFVCQNAGIPYTWRPSTREFIFEETGARVYGFSGEEPDSLRGPQFHAAWIDEPAHIDLIEEVWDNLLFGLRLPGLPGGAKVIVTGTPTPIPFIKNLSQNPRTRLVTGSTYDNLSNLDPTFRQAILDAYEGTHKGQQELYGEILMELKDSLWKLDMISYADPMPDRSEMDRVVVSIDPAGSVGQKSDETGIIAVGIIGRIGYVMADITGKYSPEGWARAAIELHEDLRADAIVAEKNFGGDMVRSNLEHYMEASGRHARIIITTASRSKELRAEPIVGLYEQGRIMHARGLVKLEEEMLGWVPGKGKSPNRVDSLVHGFTELFRSSTPGAVARPVMRRLTTNGVFGNPKRPGARSIFDPR